MNRDLVAPLGVEDESFPCPSCGGSGRISIQQMAVFANCPDCGGSGYGPPPPAAEHSRHHCLCRLAKWARREPIEEKP